MRCEPAPSRIARIAEQPRPRIGVIVAMVMACTMMIGVTEAQPRAAEQHDLTTAVKAAVVYRLTKHVEWPDEVFNDTEEERAPIVIGIVGRDVHGFEPYLAQVVRGERTQDRRLVVRRFTFPEPEATEEEVDEARWEEFLSEIRQTQLLFIARSERTLLFGRYRFRTILEAIEDHPILTVSDIPFFADAGGMIGMAIREDRWTLDANLRSIRRTQLRVDSRLLSLTHIVDQGRDPDTRRQ